MPAETTSNNGAATTAETEVVNDTAPATTGVAHRLHRNGAPGTHVMIHRNVVLLGVGFTAGTLLTLWLTGFFKRR